VRKKIRSYLKGLAENRARAGGAVARLETMAALLSQELAEARKDLESCDRLIKKYDQRLDPSRIEPIREWRHHKGKRGDLRDLLVDIIEHAAPAPLTLVHICLEIEMQWQLDFLSDQDRLNWRRDSIARALRQLVSDKKITAFHTKKGGDSRTEIAYWGAIDSQGSLTTFASLPQPPLASEAVPTAAAARRRVIEDCDPLQGHSLLPAPGLDA
jgi:hypothetical protein